MRQGGKTELKAGDIVTGKRVRSQSWKKIGIAIAGLTLAAIAALRTGTTITTITNGVEKPAETLQQGHNVHSGGGGTIHAGN